MDATQNSEGGLTQGEGNPHRIGLTEEDSTTPNLENKKRGYSDPDTSCHHHHRHHHHHHYHDYHCHHHYHHYCYGTHPILTAVCQPYRSTISDILPRLFFLSDQLCTFFVFSVPLTQGEGVCHRPHQSTEPIAAAQLAQVQPQDQRQRPDVRVKQKREKKVDGVQAY